MSRRRLLCGHCDRPSAAPAPLVEAHCEHCGRRLLDGRVARWDGRALRRHLQHDGLPLLVLCHAPGCAHCRRAAAAQAAVARRLVGRLRAARVDVAAHPALARRHHIRAVPTFLLFRRGRAVARLDGAPTTARLTSWLEPQL